MIASSLFTSIIDKVSKIPVNCCALFLNSLVCSFGRTLALQENYAFLERTGLGSVPQVLLNGVPLKRNDLSVDSFEETVVGSILKLTPQIQKDVYNVSVLFVFLGGMCPFSSAKFWQRSCQWENFDFFLIFFLYFCIFVDCLA